MNNPTNNFFAVTAAAHPFAVERLHRQIATGKSVAEIIRQFQPDPLLRRHVHAFLDGHALPNDHLARIYPKAGTTLSLRMVPMGGGGGGKNPLRTVLSLAILAASPALATGISGALGVSAGTTFLGIGAGRLITTGVNLLGRLALNALAPPARPRFSALGKESPSLFIQGARNQAVPFGRVPRVLGQHRMVPPLGALPYTETVGKDQYLRMLFIWGYGPLHINDLKIGETPLADFDDIEIETRFGYENDAPLTLYTNSVLQNDLQVGLRKADGFITRTTEADAEEISLDITLPRGLFKFNAANAKTTATIQLEIQCAPTGTNDWSAPATGYKAIAATVQGNFPRPSPYIRANRSYPVRRIDRIVLDPASGACKILQGVPFRVGLDKKEASPPAVPKGFLAIARVERQSGDAAVIPASKITDERKSSLFGASFQTAGDFLATPATTADKIDIAAGGLQFTGLLVSAKQSSALRKSVSFRVAKGQYDVRIRRLTKDATDDNTFDETVWTALRTIRSATPVKMTGIAMTALRIRATDQLNGLIDRFNGVVHSILPDWNGTAWVEQVTANPAALFRHVLQGKANARPLADSRLDLEKIRIWHEACAATEREFNAIIDYDISVQEVLQDVAAAGRASPALQDGKWTVVEDRLQTIPVQHFTPRNTFRFQGQKSFDDIPHALRVRFINREKGWLQDERLVFDDGYDETTALRYDSLSLTGVTSAEQAWQDGRYHIATAKLRPENYIFYTDIEHIVCTRGDLIRFSHDVPLFGLAGARVKTVIDNGEAPALATGLVLDAEMTMAAGKNYALRIRQTDGTSLLLSVTTEEGRSSTLSLATPIPLTEAPHAGDLVIFGESGSESVELIVKSIEPQSNLSARIICVDAAPAVHDAGNGAIPAFSSQITMPSDMQRPPTPVLSQIQSGEEVLIRQTDGSLTSRILVTLQPPAFSSFLDTEVLIRAADETSFRPAEILGRTQNRISVTDVTEGESYDLQIRYITSAGAHSSPLAISGHRVTGTTALPSDIENVTLNILGQTAYLSWMPVTDPDLSHYVLRFSPAITGANWSSAVDIVSRIAMDSSSLGIPAAVGTYFLKAVDTGGRMSATAAQVTSTIAALSGFNAILTVSEDSAFAGTRDGLERSGPLLQLNGIDSLDNWENIDNTVNVDIGDAGLLSSGIYNFANTADLGAVYTSRLTADLLVEGLDLNGTIDNRDNIDALESFDEAADPSLWSVGLQLRTTKDNPGAGPDWTPWMPFVVGDYTARAYEFRVIIQSYAANVTPALSRLRINIDMPDRTAGAGNITAAITGSAVAFDRPFRAVPALSITAQNMQSGDYYAITAQTAAGFSIQFFNSSGTGISRTFDYLAQGYGEAV